MGFVLEANPYNFDYPDNAYGFTFFHPSGQGIGALCPEIPQIIADMQSVGATMCNYQIPWSRLETSQGVFAWGALDAAVNAFNQAGINLMFDIFTAPTWWLTRVCSCDSSFSYPDVQGLTNFAVAIAQRYNGVFNVPGYGPLKIQALMVGNEDFDSANANVPSCCRALGGKYLAPVMVSVVPAVAAVNATCMVIPACLLKQNAAQVSQWIADYYSGGAGPYTKIMHVHFYKGINDPLTTGYTWDDAWTTIDQANIAAGYTHMPIWVTEYGWPVTTQGHPSATTPALQWQYMQEMLDNARTNGRVMKLLWYEIGTYDGDSLTQGGLIGKTVLSGTLAANAANVTSIPIQAANSAIPLSVLGTTTTLILGYGGSNPQTVTLAQAVNAGDTTIKTVAFTVNSTGFSSGASIVPTEIYVQPTWSNLQAYIASHPAWAFKNNNVASSYAQAVQTDGALAYYRLDETIGSTAYDSSGNFYAASVSQATLAQSGAITGDTDTCMAFASGGGITLPTSLNYSSFAAYSIEFWTFEGGAWHYVVATTTSTSSTSIYKDGVFNSSVSGRPSLSSLFSFFGTYTALDELAVYNYALSSTQISNHFIAAGGAISTGGSGYTLGSGSSEDLNLYKKQLVKVYKADFTSNYTGADSTFLGLWPDAPLLSGFKETLNGGIDPITIELPRLWDSISSDATIVQGNLVQYWLVGPGLPATGKLRYQGVIDKYEPSIDAQGKECIKVTITPYSSVIADRGIVATLNFGTSGSGSTYVDPVTMFSYFFNNTDPLTGYPYLLPLFLNAANPTSSGRTLQYTFKQQNFDSIFNTILLMLPNNWFYRVNADRSVDINVAPVTPQHIFFVGQHLVEPAYSQDTSTLKNLISLQGKGTLQTTVAGSDTKTYGARLYQKADSRITDASTLETIANGYLALLDQVLLRCPIKVYDYRGDTQYGIGYDIESIKVGDTVMFVNTAGGGPASLWDTMKWDTDAWDASGGAIFNTVVQVTELTYGFDYVQLQLGSPQPNVNRSLFKIGQDLQDFTIINT